jgi:hypothetical protein
MKKILISVLFLTLIVLIFVLKLSPHVFAWQTNDGNYGWTCFPAGTKILMSDGSQKNIEDVKVGDKVMGWDGKKQSEETVLELDSPIRDHLYKLFFEDGTTLRLTREHPLFTKEGWKAINPDDTRLEMPWFTAGKLKVGDSVFNSNGKYVKIVKMEYASGLVQTYNLKNVSRNNNFYADSYLAHNKQDTCISCDTGKAYNGMTLKVFSGLVSGTNQSQQELLQQGENTVNWLNSGGNDGGGGGGGGGALTETTTIAQTASEATLAGGEDFCKELTVDKTVIKASESATLTARAKIPEIIKVSYKFFNLDNLDSDQKPKPIRFESNVNFEVINNKTVASDTDVLAVPFEALDKKDLNWNYYMSKPKRIAVVVYFTNTTNKTSKYDNKCSVNFQVNSIDPTPTPNPNCNCSDTGSCATACFFDKFAQGVNYSSPMKCNLPNTLFQTAPTATDKKAWCQAYLRTKGDANGDGKVNRIDYYYYVSAKHGAKLPPSVTVDFNGDGFISQDDRKVLIKSLKP